MCVCGRGVVVRGVGENFVLFTLCICKRFLNFKQAEHKYSLYLCDRQH